MCFFGLVRPCECGRSPIGLVEVTAADRAAVTVQHTQYPQKASPERGGARRAGGGVRPPTPHVRGGSGSRRGLTPLTRSRAQLSGGTNSAGTTPSSANRSSGGGSGEALLAKERPPTEFSPSHSATSSIIMKVKPISVHHVTGTCAGEDWLSGISSVNKTQSMAPAAKQSRKGSA